MDIRNEKGRGNYDFADITEEDIRTIADLEVSLSKKNNKDIILIAYKNSSGQSNNEKTDQFG